MVAGLRVFIDTNILVSGFWFDGPPRELLGAAVVGGITLVISQVVLREAEQVIKKKSPSRMKEFAEFMEDVPAERIPMPSERMILWHRKYVTHDEDAPVLASAILADADYVVTGDKGFANTAVKEMVEVVSCSEILLLLPPRKK